MKSEYANVAKYWELSTQIISAVKAPGWGLCELMPMADAYVFFDHIWSAPDVHL